jgi:hypothetical protein
MKRLSTNETVKTAYANESSREIKPFIYTRLQPVLRIRIRIRIRMNPHDFGLLDPHPESAFQMRIPDADADSD